jgi:hypothetical protein
MTSSTLLNTKKLRVFKEAFREGYGLSKADRAFVKVTAENPGRRFAYMLIVGIMVAAAIFLGMFYFRVPAETSNLVYKILMFGTFLGVLLGSVFIVGMATDFIGMRLHRAQAVAECSSKGTVAACSRDVASGKYQN